MRYDENPFQFLIIRHAHRTPIPKGQFGTELPITNEGKKASETLGSSLKDIPWAAVHTSPLVRCKQTADHFIKGTQKQIPIIHSQMLGDPGPFVEDPEKAAPLFLQHSLSDIKQKLLSSTPLPGIRSLEEGTHLFMEYLKTIQTYPCLMISHDLIISLLASHLLKKDVPFPPFLDGFYIGNNIFLRILSG